MGNEVYSIPLRFRRMENLHIVFWLFKDVAWCLQWKALAIVMIVPTLVISIVIAYRNRSVVSETCHNVAISFWISANSYWMISEFLQIDNIPVFGEFTYKHLAVIPFTIGLLILGFYYLIWKPRNSKAELTM
jgi:hypothetical protein